MKPYFKFKILILDDLPSKVQKDRSWLEEQNFIVDILDDPDKIVEFYEMLIDSHIILCDLKFSNFPRNGEPAFIPRNNLSDKREFITKWITAVQRWSDQEQPSQDPDDIPRSLIYTKDIGFWLAALVSQVSPDCEIIFYSIANEEIQGALAAIEQFQGSRFSADTKNPDSRITEAVFYKALERRQRQLLKRLPHVYQWFLRKVYLPIQIDEEPTEGSAVQLSLIDQDKEFSLKADFFFPQLMDKETHNEKKEFLREFLINEDWQLQPWEKRALNGLEHDLRPKICEFYSHAMQAERVDYFDRLLVTAVDAGTAGQGVLALLEIARDDLQEKKLWPAELLNSAYDLCCGVLRNSEWDLEKLCADFQSTDISFSEASGCFLVDGTCAVEPGTPAEQSNLHLPFPLPYLRRVISALKHNLEGHLDAQKARRFSLRAKVEASSLTISWEDNSNGFFSIEDFRDAVMKSVTKDDAEHRGLPMAILFGVEFAAESVEVLIRCKNGGSGPKWHLIYPTSNVNAFDALNDETGFGFRWKFKHPRQ